MSKYIQDLEATIARLKPFLPEYLREQGVDITKNFTCPFPDHEDKHPSCSLIQSETNPRGYCHSDGRYFDIIDACYLYEKKPRAGVEWVYDTVKYLAEKYKVELKLSDLTAEQAYELDTYRAYHLAASLLKTSGFEECKGNEALNPFRQAMSKRGWSEETITVAGIGTVPDYIEFRAALRGAGFSATFLDEIDLGRKDIFNPDNMIFTWRDEHGRPVGFAARNLRFEEQEKEAKKQGKENLHPKYNNQRTTGLKCNIFQKGKRLYGLDKAIEAQPPLYLFEGQADVITARQNGLLNCVGLGGSNLSTDHVLLLKELGCYDLIVCLDGDEAGQTKQAQIVEEKLAGHRDLRVRVIILPEGEDPDSFIRKNGVEAFKKLAIWNAFEWRLNKYPEDEDTVTISRQMIPFIVNEPSAIERENLCKILARRTGITLKAITEELNNLLNIREYERSRERQEVLERIQYNLTRNPLEAELILREGCMALGELSKRYNADNFSIESFLKAIDEQKDIEEKRSNKYEGFQLGPDFRPLQDALCGEWSKDVLLLFGSKENVGKTGFFAKLAYSIANYNDNVMCICLTIDDTKEQVFPRFVCIAEGSRQLTINQVKQPAYWDGLGEQNTRCRGILSRRELGYMRIKELVRAKKLLLKDANDGQSLSFIESIISYYQEEDPTRKIVFFLDNFHKLSDFSNAKDERIRFKTLSNALKGLAVKYHIPIFATVEYTKLPAGTKANNHSVSETVALSYDSNFIGHLYSEVSDIPDKYTVCHRDYNWRGEQVVLPRIELNIGKNKISDFKGTIYFDFWPASSDYRYVDQETVASDQQQMKEERRQQRNQANDDVFGGAYDERSNNRRQRE